MIYLSKTSAGSNGQLAIRNYQTSGPYENTARLSRVKTLDGGCAFGHYGVTYQDRDLSIDCTLSPADLATVKDYFENALLIRVSFWEGSFSGYIKTLKAGRNGVATITFYLKEKLNQ